MKYVTFSFHVMLLSVHHVPVCLDVPSVCLCLPALPFFKRSVLALAPSLRKLEN